MATYEALRALPSAGNAPALGAIRAAGLIALRQRELGMVDEGYLRIAKRLAADTSDLPAWVSGTLDVVEVLEVSIGGVTRPALTDAALDRMRALRANRTAYSKLLRDFSEVDELSAYTWLTFMCSSVENRDMTVADIFAGVSPFRDAPLMAFKEASCRGVIPEKLTALVAASRASSRPRTCWGSSRSAAASSTRRTSGSIARTRGGRGGPRSRSRWRTSR